MKGDFASPPPNLAIFSPASGFVVNILVPSIATTEMQRPDRRQVRNLRHAKQLTGIVAELPVQGHPPRLTKTISPRLVLLNLS